jgi:hypothetical protein
MKPTNEQLAAIEKMQLKYPSMLPITYGWFSDGSISLHMAFKDNPNEVYFQTVEKDGSLFTPPAYRYIIDGAQSNCCNAPVYEQTDICTECGEHCDLVDNNQQ